jgi:arylsulfatase A-like enzyme
VIEVQIRARMLGALRGAGLGLLGGALWFTLEAVGSWAAGSAIPLGILQKVAGLDLVIAAIAGLLLGAALPNAGGTVLALGLAAVYGFLRVYAPPGLGAEAAFVGVAIAAVFVARRVVGEKGAVLAFIHLTVLGAASLLVAEIILDESRANALRGMRLPLLIAVVPLVGVVADRILSFVLRKRALRFGLELTAAAVALVVLGRPLSTAPVLETVITAVPPPAGTPDIILVSLDTTRADHMSLYGYERPTSPQLEEFAKDALVFTQARTTAGWTLPGHASMLTGMYPSRHGAHLAGGFQGGQSIDGRRNVAFPLAADKTTMTEVLRDRGYHTGAFVSNFSYLYRDFGLAQGFNIYDDKPGLLMRLKPPVVRFVQRFSPGFCLKPFRSARDINASSLVWLDAQAKDRPAFVFLNYMEPHQPWLAPAPFDQWVWGLPEAHALATQNLYTHEVKDFTKEQLDFIVANYDGQVAAMDHAFGELIEALKARGRYENALIIVTADHGELLGDHGQVGHMGRMLYEGLLHIPMIVKFPGEDRPRGRVDTPVQNLDVPPTALTIAGAPIPAGVQGQHLRDVTRPSFAEEDINPFLVTSYGEFYDRGMRVLFDGNWKLIKTSRGEKYLYDLSRDPSEQNDLAAAEPERVAELAKRLEAKLSTMVAKADSQKQVN